MLIKHIKYIKKNQAKGHLKRLYKHMELNFGKLAEPFVIHSIDEELTAGIWAVFYETILVDGEVKRSLKEAIATSVSEINKCNYCVDAHTIMIFGTEKILLEIITTIKEGKTIATTQEEKLVFWALQNLKFDSSIILNPPFTKDKAPEIIGTAVLFHYINRMVNLFAGNTPLPTTKMRGALIRIASGFIFAKAIKKKKIKGESLLFIDEGINGDSFTWAGQKPVIQKAFQYFKYQTEHKIDQILSPALISLLKSQATQLNLIKSGFGNEKLEIFLKTVKPAERQIAEFCFLTMFESHKVYEKHFQGLKQRFKDAEILRVAAFVSMLIADRIGQELYKLPLQ